MKRVGQRKTEQERAVYVIENLKKAVKQVVGTGPSRAAAQVAVGRRKPKTMLLRDDGTVPNNPTLPLIHYQNAVRLTNSEDPATIFERLFESNGWKGTWRNGIYDYVHYHSNTLEVLGIARGEARVRFGGDKGGGDKGNRSLGRFGFSIADGASKTLFIFSVQIFGRSAYLILVHSISHQFARRVGQRNRFCRPVAALPGGWSRPPRL
jgi:hypothetical protein